MSLSETEGITGFSAKAYSFLAKRTRVIRDLYEAVADEVVSRISSGRILDVGSGPGYLPLRIADKSKTLETVGVDISPTMIEIASGNALKAGLSERVKFQLGDAASLPYDDGYFDLVLSTLTFHHFSKPERSLGEMCRVLRDGGEAWIYDIRKDIPKDAEKRFKEKYGYITSFIYLRVIKGHTSVTRQRVEAIISSPEIACPEKSTEDVEVFLKLKLSK